FPDHDSVGRDGTGRCPVRPDQPAGILAAVAKVASQPRSRDHSARSWLVRTRPRTLRTTSRQGMVADRLHLIHRDDRARPERSPDGGPPLRAGRLPRPPPRGLIPPRTVDRYDQVGLAVLRLTPLSTRFPSTRKKNPENRCSVGGPSQYLEYGHRQDE